MTCRCNETFPDGTVRHTCPPATGLFSPAYTEGWNDGAAGKEPNLDRLALGANRRNDYEQGYIDSGQGRHE